jgi:hypothetical protein
MSRISPAVEAETISSTWAGKAAAVAALIPRTEVFMATTIGDSAAMGCRYRKGKEYSGKTAGRAAR